jgi:copper oxidase (laccase) domain-containing protein
MEKQPTPARIFRASSLEGLLPGVFHGFSSHIPFATVPSFRDALGNLLQDVAPANGSRPVMLEQPHAANILRAREDAGEPSPAVEPPGEDPLRERAPDFARGYDGAVGNVGSPATLSVRAADCVPVLAMDPELGAFGVLHAGWRGIAAGILPNLLAIWRRAGSSLTEARLAFGPGIGVCCFEVRADCLGAFQSELLDGSVKRVEGVTHLDLVAVLKKQARAGGVDGTRIEVLPFCTACHRDADGSHPFASYRRSRWEGVRTPGRNASFIGVAAGHTGT